MQMVWAIPHMCELYDKKTPDGFRKYFATFHAKVDTALAQAILQRRTHTL